MIETEDRVIFGFEELDKILGSVYGVFGISQGSLNFIVCKEPNQQMYFFPYLKEKLVQNNLHLSNQRKHDFDENNLNADISDAFKLNNFHTTCINTNSKIYILTLDPSLCAVMNQLPQMQNSLIALRNILLLLDVTLFVLLNIKDYNMSKSYKWQADNVLHVSYSYINDMADIKKSIRFMIEKARHGKSQIAIEYLVR